MIRTLENVMGYREKVYVLVSGIRFTSDLCLTFKCLSLFLSSFTLTFPPPVCSLERALKRFCILPVVYPAMKIETDLNFVALVTS